MSKEQEAKVFSELGKDLISMLEYMAKNKILLLEKEDYIDLGRKIDTVINSKYYVLMPWLEQPLKNFYASFKTESGRYYTGYNESYKALFDPMNLTMLALTPPKEK